MKVIITDGDGNEIDSRTDKDKLRSCLSYLHGCRNSYNQMQTYINNEMSNISLSIEKIESLLMEG